MKAGKRALVGGGDDGVDAALDDSANAGAAAVMVKRRKVAGKGTGGRDGYMYYFRYS